jgi:hypothetical protein
VADHARRGRREHDHAVAKIGGAVVRRVAGRDHEIAVRGIDAAPLRDQIAESLDGHVRGTMIARRSAHSEFQTWTIRPTPRRS